MSARETAAALLSVWDERDRAAGWLPSDRRALDDAGALRLLCLELLLSGNPRGPDLYHACSRLGGTLAERGGSPSLAAVALDGAKAAVDAHPESRRDGPLDDVTWHAARAALMEGFVRFTRDESERASFASWEPPRCFVVVEPAFAVVTAGHPSGDADVLGPWAGRVAGALLVRGVRRAVVGGEGRAAAAVLAALTESGIAATGAPPASRLSRS